MSSDLVLEQLKEMVNILQRKEKYPIVLVNTKSDFTTQFSTPISLNPNRDYEIALLWFTAYNTIFNFDSSNNKFHYSIDSGIKWTSIILPEGAYEINSLNNAIKSTMKANGHWDSVNNECYINLSISLATSKSIVTIRNAKYVIDFTQPNTIRERLGFNSKILSSGTNVSDNIVQITNISTINIECNICEGSYFNGKLGNILYTFPSYTVPVGYKIIERISFPIYLPVSLKTISHIRIRIIDEDGKLINFNNEEIAMVLELRQV